MLGAVSEVEAERWQAVAGGTYGRGRYGRRGQDGPQNIEIIIEVKYAGRARECSPEAGPDFFCA